MNHLYFVLDTFRVTTDLIQPVFILSLGSLIVESVALNFLVLYIEVILDLNRLFTENLAVFIKANDKYILTQAFTVCTRTRSLLQ